MTTEPASVTAPTDLERYGLEKVRMHLESGLLGRIFGSAANAPANIAGVVACLLVVPIAVLAFIAGKSTVVEYVQAAGPFVTLALGYLFGRRSTSSGAP